MSYRLIKGFLFLFSAERAHHLTTSLFKIIITVPLLGQLVKMWFAFDSKLLQRELFGLKFKNPVGLAAGFDKNGKFIKAISTLGFGFIEVGTITPQPQDGNPRPRLFRLPKDEAIINRMGFNNEGVDALVTRLKNLGDTNVIIGGNIGKNKTTPNDQAHNDYLICFQKLYSYVDYFVVNLSSPNTPGLRSLQNKEPLKKILKPLLDYRETQSLSRPILLKIAPDLSEEQLDDILHIVQEYNIDGIISSNTTIDKSGLNTDTQVIQHIGEGGLSGLPLTKRSTDMIRSIQTKTNGQLPIIGVGGINSGSTAHDKIKAGASLIQVYTGLIFKGPLLIKNIKKHLVAIQNI